MLHSGRQYSCCGRDHHRSVFWLFGGMIPGDVKPALELFQGRNIERQLFFLGLDAVF
jgi:hypothetical protein